MAVLAGSVFLVHDVGYLLGHPYWLDEAWVADSIRAPLSKLPFLTSSSPIGWTFLLRLVPGSGSGQSARLVPLLFCSLTAVAGYLLGEALRLRRHVTGILVGAAALLAPAMVVRDDLKQYTAEAFASVAILAVVAHLENRWSRRRLGALACVVAAGALFAATTAFVGAAVFAGLVVEALLVRDRRRLVETVVAGAAAGAALGVVFLLTIGPADIPSLKKYWTGYYLGGSTLAHQLDVRLHQLLPFTAGGHLWLVAVLVGAAVVLLAVHGRWALALSLPLVLLMSVAAGLARAYPFGDPRTSTYWLVLVPVMMAVTASYAADAAGRVHGLVVPVVAAAALLAWVPSAAPYANARTIPSEDVRSPVRYLDRHMAPGDVVVLSQMASYGFAFYDHRFQPTWSRFPVAANGFLPTYPETGPVVQLRGRDAAAVDTALRRAVADIDSEPTGRRGVIWIVRSHQTGAEAAEWGRLLAGRAVSSVGGGPEPLLQYRP